ncbi:MAG: 4-deoxy-4-formamido-L-arabinose-phosphoundecaprenol deformylase [Deltaproteobacteria bacterium]|nr:4-deoxy-4-formamido-L-arabinose-phosphoundecaprenol deformylase [Deltaproteobacteria bacterium]
MREGVPRLLELFKQYALRASFFISFGPDRSGRAIRRLWRPSFLLKMMRTNPLRLYGVRTLLSGTLLPSKPIGEAEAEILRSIPQEGHEIGIHGYDHVRWQDGIESMEEGEIELELKKSMDAYERIFGKHPLSTAAPGWRCTSLSLAVQERLGFLYASDVRGKFPFFPVHNGRTIQTLQIPTTLPTADELIGRRRELAGVFLSSMGPGLNVLTVHAEVEGRAYVTFFRDFLEGVLKRKAVLVSLGEVAQLILQRRREAVPRLAVRRGKVPGRSGWVAMQGPLAA